MSTTNNGFKKLQSSDLTKDFLPAATNTAGDCIYNDNVDKTVEELGKKQDKITLTTSGAGNAVSGVSFADDTLTVTKTTINGAEYTVAKQATAETGYSNTYYLIKDGTQVGEKINIPKDLVVQSGSVQSCTTADTPVSGYVVGDKYIDLVIANSDNQHIYIKVSDLVDQVSISTTGDGNAITAISAAGDTVTATKGETFLTEHPAITAGTNTTDTQTAAFGGEVSLIDGITKDGNGHVTAYNTKTITLPAETQLSRGTDTQSNTRLTNSDYVVTGVSVNNHEVTLTTKQLPATSGGSGTSASTAEDVTFTPPSGMTATNVQDAIEAVFQSSSDAQNAYETAITGKSGTVSKAGTVATKTEIVAGISGIPQSVTGNFTDTEVGNIETVITTKGGTIEKDGDVATSAELVTGINSIPTNGSSITLDPIYGDLSEWTAVIIPENLTTSTTFTEVENASETKVKILGIGNNFTADGFTDSGTTGINATGGYISFDGVNNRINNPCNGNIYSSGFTTFIVYSTNTISTANLFYKNPCIYGKATDGYDRGDFGICTLNGYLGLWIDDRTGAMNFLSDTIYVSDNNKHIACLSWDATNKYRLYNESGLVYTNTYTHGDSSYGYSLFNENYDTSVGSGGALSGNLYSFAERLGDALSETEISVIINKLKTKYSIQ